MNDDSRPARRSGAEVTPGFRRGGVSAQRAVAMVAVLAMGFAGGGCAGSSDSSKSADGGAREPTLEKSASKSVGLTAWAAEDWTVRGFAGRDLFEFGRNHGYSEAPTNEMRITKLDGTQVMASKAPFDAGLDRPSAKGSRDGRVLVIGRPCTHMSTENVDSSGIDCPDKPLAAAVYDIASDSWEAIDVPDVLAKGTSQMPSIKLVGFVDGVAYVTAYPDFAMTASASWGVWYVESGEVIAGDAGWTAADQVESCVLANGTRHDVRSVGSMLSSGKPATKVEISETSNGPDGLKSPLPKTVDQPVALRCDEETAVAARLPTEGRPQTVEGASDLVSGDDVATAINGTVVLPGEGAFVGTDEAGKRTVLLGGAGPIVFGAAIGGYTISNGVDVLFVDNVDAENVALVRTDSADKIDADRLAKLFPTPPKFVNKVGDPTTTTTK